MCGTVSQELQDESNHRNLPKVINGKTDGMSTGLPLWENCRNLSSSAAWLDVGITFSQDIDPARWLQHVSWWRNIT